MRRRFLIATNELLWHALMQIECWADTALRWADRQGTAALWRSDHARGGEHAARWHE